MLTNHEYVWQASNDERRAVVIESGESLRGNLEFWKQYHAWVLGDGPAALLHYLQGVDLAGFNPRAIPKAKPCANRSNKRHCATLLRPGGTSASQKVLSGGVMLLTGWCISIPTA